MSYYTRWGLIIGTPYFQKFLQTSYAQGVSELKLLNREEKFSSHNFTALLCGVGNEATARSFIQFVIKRNPKAKIYIIDLGSEQIKAVQKMIKSNFSEYDITAQQINALNLQSLIKNSSIDWIETDGFLEFFPYEDLLKLLEIWHALLKPKGFITIRETASSSFLGSIADFLRIKVAKWWLGITLYKYTLLDLDKIFHHKGFKFVSFTTIIPTYRRFTLVKESLF